MDTTSSVGSGGSGSDARPGTSSRDAGMFNDIMSSSVIDLWEICTTGIRDSTGRLPINDDDRRRRDDHGANLSLSDGIVPPGRSVEAGSAGTFAKVDRPGGGEKVPEIVSASVGARAVGWETGTAALAGIEKKKLRGARRKEGGGGQTKNHPEIPSEIGRPRLPTDKRTTAAIRRRGKKNRPEIPSEIGRPRLPTGEKPRIRERRGRSAAQRNGNAFGEGEGSP